MLDEIVRMSDSEPDANHPLTAVSYAKKINLKEAKKHELNELSKEIKGDSRNDRGQFMT